MAALGTPIQCNKISESVNKISEEKLQLQRNALKRLKTVGYHLQNNLKQQ